MCMRCLLTLWAHLLFSIECGSPNTLSWKTLGSVKEFRDSLEHQNVSFQKGFSLSPAWKLKLYFFTPEKYAHWDAKTIGIHTYTFALTGALVCLLEKPGRSNCLTEEVSQQRSSETVLMLWIFKSSFFPVPSLDVLVEDILCGHGNVSSFWLFPWGFLPTDELINSFRL